MSTGAGGIYAGDVVRGGDVFLRGRGVRDMNSLVKKALTDKSYRNVDDAVRHGTYSTSWALVVLLNS